MSDALDYLLRVRPEPMRAYFDYLKLAPGSLDPKTRAIISVITKVSARTERGFVQYLKRALNAGVSASEILDALIMSMPMLGLTGVIWAIDLLLAMDLPEFRPDALQSIDDWTPLGPVTGFTVGGTHFLEVAGQGLFVHIAAEGPQVFRARCPHQGMPLAEADIEDACITCPRHGWRFHAHDGSPAGGQGLGLAACRSRVREGCIEVQLKPLA